MRYFLVRNITLHDDEQYYECIIISHDDDLPENANEWLTLWNNNCLPTDLDEDGSFHIDYGKSTDMEKYSFVDRELGEHEAVVLSNLFLSWSWRDISRFIEYKLEKMGFKDENYN